MHIQLCALAAALAFVARGPIIGAQNAPPPPRNFRVTLLGTGSPTLSDTRFGPSTLVEAGDQRLVFDAGRGAAQRLQQLGVPFDRIDAIFLTHLHSDHVVGLPDLWLTGWILGRRTVPWELVGPTGTAAMAAHLAQAFAFDIDIRVREGGQTAAGARLAARDVAPGVVYERGSRFRTLRLHSGSTIAGESHSKPRPSRQRSAVGRPAEHVDVLSTRVRRSGRHRSQGPQVFLDGEAGQVGRVPPLVRNGLLV